MKKESMRVQIDEELYRAASEAAAVMSRSTAEQLDHWARIGWDLAASPEVSVEKVTEVLRGVREYDSLDTEEQAVVRAYWSERMAALQDALRLDRDFAAEGRPCVELDDGGKVARPGGHELRPS